MDGATTSRVASASMHSRSAPTPRPWTFDALARLVSGPQGVDGNVHRFGARVPHDVRILGATHHSGRVRPGDAFFALPGEQGHGIEFADAALEAGASIVVSDRPHPYGLVVDDPATALVRVGRWARSRLHAPVVGVTGSAGKTTAKTLVAAALGAAASPGNLNTTWALAGILARHYATGDRRPLVLEMGIDRVGEMDALVDLVRPDVGLLVLVGPAHLDAFVDLEGVAFEKSKLLAGSPRRLVSRQAAGFLPPHLLETCIVYGLDGTPDERSAESVDVAGAMSGTWDAPSVRIVAPWPLEVRLPGHGEGTAESSVAALAVADLLGLDVQQAASRLSSAVLETGRLTVQRVGARYVVDDTYNANPASLRVALRWLADAPRPHALVLGDMLELGDQAEEAHLQAGDAASGVDHLIVMGRHAARVAERRPSTTVVFDDDAMQQALDALPGDATILVKASRSAGFERFVRYLTNRSEGRR